MFLMFLMPILLTLLPTNSLFAEDFDHRETFLIDAKVQFDNVEFNKKKEASVSGNIELAFFEPTQTRRYYYIPVDIGRLSKSCLTHPFFSEPKISFKLHKLSYKKFQSLFAVYKSAESIEGAEILDRDDWSKGTQTYIRHCNKNDICMELGVVPAKAQLSEEAKKCSFNLVAQRVPLPVSEDRSKLTAAEIWMKTNPVYYEGHVDMTKLDRDWDPSDSTKKKSIEVVLRKNNTEFDSTSFASKKAVLDTIKSYAEEDRLERLLKAEAKKIKKIEASIFKDTLDRTAPSYLRGVVKDDSARAPFVRPNRIKMPGGMADNKDNLSRNFPVTYPGIGQDKTVRVSLVDSSLIKKQLQEIKRKNRAARNPGTPLIDEVPLQPLLVHRMPFQNWNWSFEPYYDRFFSKTPKKNKEIKAPVLNVATLGMKNNAIEKISHGVIELANVDPSHTEISRLIPVMAAGLSQSCLKHPLFATAKSASNLTGLGNKTIGSIFKTYRAQGVPKVSRGFLTYRTCNQADVCIETWVKVSQAPADPSHRSCEFALTPDSPVFNRNAKTLQASRQKLDLQKIDKVLAGADSTSMIPPSVSDRFDEIQTDGDAGILVRTGKWETDSTGKRVFPREKIQSAIDQIRGQPKSRRKPDQTLGLEDVNLSAVLGTVLPVQDSEFYSSPKEGNLRRNNIRVAPMPKFPKRDDGETVEESKAKWKPFGLIDLPN